MQVIYVNGIAHRVTKIGRTLYGYTDVYMSKAGESDTVGCYKLPTEWFNNPNDKRSVFTGGHKYSK